jgi:hypothetical protein
MNDTWLTPCIPPNGTSPSRLPYSSRRQEKEGEASWAAAPARNQDQECPLAHPETPHHRVDRVERSSNITVV